MKKFFTVLLFLVILGGLGTGFYFGWLQMRLGENEYGVVFSKIGGYRSEVLAPGRFIWRWEALIPKNLTLHAFKVSPRNSRVSVEGSLPSGKLYGQFFDGSPDFSYSLTLSLGYKLRPELLPALVKDEGLTPETLNVWYKEKEDQALVLAEAFLRDAMNKENFYGNDDLPKVGFSDKLLNQLNQSVEGIIFSRVTITEFTLPDLELYQKARLSYFRLLTTRESLSEGALEKATAQTIGSRANLQILEEYGQLLSEYPVLLDYLKVNPTLVQDLFRGGSN